MLLKVENPWPCNPMEKYGLAVAPGIQRVTMIFASYDIKPMDTLIRHSVMMESYCRIWDLAGIMEDRLFALQADGKIVVASPSDNLTDNFFALVRYHPDGSPDSTFGNNGIATFDFNGTYSNCYSLKISTNGKMIVAGRSGITDAVFVLLRCNPDGTPDSSFGINGIATIDITDQDYGFSTDIQPDGKILIAGHSTTGTEFEITAARILSEVATEAGLTFSGKNDFSIFPNPSFESILVTFSIAENSPVSARHIDPSGRKIKTIANGNFLAGDHHMSFSAKDLPSGIYLLQIRTCSAIHSQKLIIQSP